MGGTGGHLFYFILFYGTIQLPIILIYTLEIVYFQIPPIDFYWSVIKLFFQSCHLILQCSPQYVYFIILNLSTNKDSITIDIRRKNIMGGTGVKKKI